MFAAVRGHPEIVTLLLNAKANVDFYNINNVRHSGMIAFITILALGSLLHDMSRYSLS